MAQKQSLDSTYKTEWIIPEDLFYFQGHFPNMPILPAVGIIDISLELICSHSHRAYSLFSVESAKFSAPLEPEDRVHVFMEQAKDNLWSVRWVKAVGGQLSATLFLRLTE